MARSQAPVQSGQRVANRTWRDFNRIIMGKVIATQPEHGTVHISTTLGGILRNVRVVGQGAGGTRSGTQDLPAVLMNKPFLDPSKTEYIDENERLDRRDTQAIVAFIDGDVHRPICWLLPADAHESSFAEHNLRVDRHAGDSYAVDYPMENPPPEVLQAMLEKRAGKEDDEDNPVAWEFPRRMNHEVVYPDRRRLKGPDPLQKKPPRFDPGNPEAVVLGLETYEKVGYPYDGRWDDNDSPGDEHVDLIGRENWTKHRDFTEPPFSTWQARAATGSALLNRRPLGFSEEGRINFDDDAHPWRRHRENKIRFARGIRWNQRWGTALELTQTGDVVLVVEGLNKNVHPEMDEELHDPEAGAYAQNKNWGSWFQQVRLEEQHTAKSGWFWYRKRLRFGGLREKFDLELPELLEDHPDEVRKYGQERHRTQRTWQAISRLESELGARDVTRIVAGYVDADGSEGRWGRENLGWGSDYSRYQDRLKWRNRDSKELGNILVQSIRPKVGDSFGDDPITREKFEGGDITVRTMPQEDDRAVISLQALAYRDKGLIEGWAATNAGKEDKGKDARVHWSARSARDKATIELLAFNGTDKKEGDEATANLWAQSRLDRAYVNVKAQAGYMDVPGNDARLVLESVARGDLANTVLSARTEIGNNATVVVLASAAKGQGNISVVATSPDVAQVMISAEGTDGIITARATSKILMTAPLWDVLAVRATVAGAEAVRLTSERQVDIIAAGVIEMTAPLIRPNGEVRIYGSLWVNDVLIAG